MTTATTKTSGTTRVHPKSASQMISSWLWIIPCEARRQQCRRSSRSSCRRNAYGIQVPITRQLIATTSEGHLAIPVAARRTRSQWTKNLKTMTKGTKCTTQSSRMPQRPSTSMSTRSSRREQKLLLREIMTVEPAVPRPLRWLEVPISFSRDDQWTIFSELGKFPLVLDPVVAEVRLT
jgi:hypothetical protein